MKIRIPGLLTSYTDGAHEISLTPPAASSTLGTVLDALDRRYPGLRFRIVDEQSRIRPHIKLFVDGTLCRDLAAAVGEARELMIVGALSGG